MDKEYKSKIEHRAAKPRSKRLRNLGIGSSDVSSSIVSASGGASTLPCDGHSHNNKTVLDEISTDSERYIYLTKLEENEDGTEYEKITGKAKAGYADEAGHAQLADKATEAEHAAMAHDLDQDSPVYDRVLSSLTPDTAQGIITFLKGLTAQGLIKAEAGLEVGKNVIDSLVAGKGIIADKNGRIQADRMELRSSLTVLELIFNRLSAMESDYSFSESGTIDSADMLEDGTYNLPLRKRWENDFTALDENDIIYGMVNNLAMGKGEYYTSWMRVLHVDTAANLINVVLYPDSEVPGGKNYPPEPLMIVSRRGNPVNQERQGYWYLSSREHCICMLNGVRKPILEEHNYSIIVGKLKQLSLFDNLPVSYRDSYVFCRGFIGQDFMRVTVDGVPIVQHNDREFWRATPASPYSVSATSVDVVWHVGCKWLCLIDGTTDEPMYGSTGWTMIEGNPEFTIDIESSEGWNFDIDEIVHLYEDGQKPFTVLNLTGRLYNGDVTDHILNSDIEWTRKTDNVTEDNAWAIAHRDTGKALTLSLNDLGPHYSKMKGCKFIARAVLRDGQKVRDDKYTIEF